MDRLARILPSGLVVPLVGIVVAALPWIAFRGSPTPEMPVAAHHAADSGNRAPLTPVAQNTPPDRVVKSPQAVEGNKAQEAEGAAGPALLPPQVEAPLSEPAGRSPSTAARSEPSNLSGTGLPNTVAAQPAALQPPAGQLILPTPASRSEQLENVAKQADRHTLRGYEMVNRAAYFAARAEFLAALRLVAQGLDAEQNTSIHSRALAAGMTAMKESQDFIPTGSKLEAQIDLTAVIGSHRTPVLKDAPAEELQPMSAASRYLTFAQEQLAAAAGREVAGSMALCGLGKWHAVVGRHQHLEVAAPDSKAIVCFQAAILVYPRNHIASNELGVLLARGGDYLKARKALEHSVANYRGSTNLSNLATVCQQMGDRRQAMALQQQAIAAQRAEEEQRRRIGGSANGLVQWVPPSAMAQAGLQVADARPATPAQQSQKPQQPVQGKPAAAAPSTSKSIFGWLPWSTENTQK